jgi:hypothetical protein
VALSAEDQRLVASMREREFNIKKRQRAANAIHYESRRYRRTLVALTGLALACVAAGVFIGIASLHHDWVREWRPEILLALVGAVVGTLLGEALLSTAPGRRLLAREQFKLNRKYSGDLHAGRRWMQFFYRDEDISCYVPQILYVLDSERRFDSVPEALAFVKRHHHENTQAQAHALRQFNAIVARTNLMVVSSVNAQGQSSIRAMRFVRTDRPGVWYVTSAPNTPKVHEFDKGHVALMTAPADDGSTISSKRVRIRRAEKTFMDIAGLYRAQVPGYLDGMTDEDQELELVYELTLQSAKVDSWVGHDLVSFEEPDRSRAAVPDATLL